MTLLDLYEPIFQYICMLSRIARSGNESIAYDALRAAVVPIIEQARAQAQSEPLLALQAQKLDLPIIFFVDSMIAESGLQCADEWHRNRLAYGFNELAGDEKFFDCLDETLADLSPEATGRLVIFFVCIGLGLTGWYAGNPEYLRKKMDEIARRIAGQMDQEHVVRVCPEAYKYLDTRNLIEPPSSRIGAIAVAFLVFCIVMMAINFYLFLTGSAAFRHSLEEILKHDLELVKR